jgi:hypothetical protein
MKLQEFNADPIVNAQKALKEHYSLPFKLENLSIQDTKLMLTKVRRLMTETKKAGNFYKSQSNPSYLKLVFMEQALSKYESRLRSRPQSRIVVENEEVEKSQVVLAAQDMIDQVQKFLESVSDLSVKELPALVSSVESEIGVDQAHQFNEQASGALTQLLASLTEARTALEGALGIVTGQGGPEAFGADMGMGAPDPTMDMGGEDDLGLGDEEPELGADVPDMEEPTPDVGRPRR